MISNELFILLIAAHDRWNTGSTFPISNPGKNHLTAAQLHIKFDCPFRIDKRTMTAIVSGQPIS